MPTTIKLRNSVTTTSAPSSLVQGEVAINITDKKVWVGNAATTPIQLLGDGGSASFTSIAFGAGTVSNPSITFIGDTNTGIYSPAADTIAFTEGGVESMRIDSSGNVLGALTTGMFRISNSARSALLPTYAFVNAADVGMYNPADGTLGFVTGQVERMRIDSSGNVGIGTSSPAGKLDIISGTARMYFSNQSATAFITAVNTANSAYAPMAINGSEMILKTGDAERMRITSGGLVGIGTTTPTYRLHVDVGTGTNSGPLALIGTATSSMLFITNATGGAFNGLTVAGDPLIIGVQNQSLLVGVHDGSAIRFGDTDMRFGTDSNERMRIDSAGNLLIGTTVQSAKVTAVQSGSADVYRATIGTGGASLVTVGTGNTMTVGYWAVNAGATFSGQITCSGASTTYASASDYRLKENIAPMTGALAKVSALKPVTFNWKGDGVASQGFIAHELQEVVPECVTGEKDEVDKEGKPIYQGVDTSFLVATLTAAIQEQQAMIEELKQEVAKLKGV